jgi:PhnB protein
MYMRWRNLPTFILQIAGKYVLCQLVHEEALMNRTANSAAPAGYTTVTPWIISPDTSELLDFVKRAFGAEELVRVPNKNGSIGHAEFRVGDAIVMAFDADSSWKHTPSFLRLYVNDCDAVYQQALDAGATSVTKMTNLAFGDRVARIRDPQGNLWWIHTHLEDVGAEEMQRRAGDKRYIEAMEYVQATLTESMSAS